MPLRVFVTLLATAAVAGAVGWNLGVQLSRQVVVHVEYRRIPWDLSDPWERCLAAMEQAEIPGDMWECHERR